MVDSSEVTEDLSKISRHQALEALVEAMAGYFWAEMGWENFRSEFLSKGDEEYENARKSNAKKLSDFLHEMGDKYPDLKPLLKIQE